MHVEHPLATVTEALADISSPCYAAYCPMEDDEEIIEVSPSITSH